VEANYFIVIGLLVGLIAAISIVATLFYTRKRKQSHKKTKDLIHVFVKQKAKNRFNMHEQLARLEKQYKNGEVDDETYHRLKSVLVDVKGKKDEEVDVVNYVMNKSRPVQEKKPDNYLLLPEEEEESK
jgi:hypothetical protein